MIRIRAPDWITLFGEHQNNLNFPLISTTISKDIIEKMGADYLEIRALGVKCSVSVFRATVLAFFQDNEGFLIDLIEKVRGVAYNNKKSKAH